MNKLKDKVFLYLIPEFKIGTTENIRFPEVLWPKVEKYQSVLGW